jgi:hypothetical protein
VEYEDEVGKGLIMVPFESAVRAVLAAEGAVGKAMDIDQCLSISLLNFDSMRALDSTRYPLLQSDPRLQTPTRWARRTVYSRDLIIHFACVQGWW